MQMMMTATITAKNFVYMLTMCQELDRAQSQDSELIDMDGGGNLRVHPVPKVTLLHSQD